MINRFINQCQLRVDIYCKAFGLDKVVVPKEENDAIETLKVVAGICQPTLAAMDIASESEEQWAIDWLMDPPPDLSRIIKLELPHISEFIFIKNNYFRYKKKYYIIEGWPLSWNKGKFYNYHFGCRKCLTYKCNEDCLSDYEFCEQCVDKLNNFKNIDIEINLSTEEMDILCRFVLKHPFNDKDLSTIITGSKYVTDSKSVELCRVYNILKEIK